MTKVFLLSIGFSPNVGGIETHFDDLTFYLDRKGIKVFVLTYKPITTKAKAPLFEKRGKNIKIYRLPCFRGIFYKFRNKPFFEFLFFVPALFFALPLFLLTTAKDVNVIHTHGLIVGFVGVFWGKIFKKKVITTTHSLYSFPKRGIYREVSRLIFINSDKVLTLSKRSKDEIKLLDIPESKINVFTYWVDLNKFKPIKGAKENLGWRYRFVVLFVGRLVQEKGVLVLLDALQKWNRNIYLAVAGTGPLEKEIYHRSLAIENLIFLGKVDNSKLPLYYSASDLVIVPSIHEEGFGRVILEALACGTPVIASNRGSIPEAMDKTVGMLIKVTPENIKKAVEYFYDNPKELAKLSRNARKFAEKHYSQSNAEKIIKEYTFKS